MGDEIEVLMAELGEREPIEVPAASGNGGRSPFVPGGNGQAGDGNGQQPSPPRPDTAPEQ